MGESFGFGDPAEERSAPALRATAPRGRGAFTVGPALLLVVGLLLVVVLIAGYLLFLRDAGESVAQSQADTVGQIGNAQDLQAQVNLTNSSHAALALVAEGSVDPADGGYAVADADALMAMAGGGVTFIAGVSGGPNQISIATGANDWAAAARSESGSCLYIHVENDLVFYGSGQPCTGQAAMSAAAEAW